MSPLPPDLPHDFSDPNYMDDDYVRPHAPPRGSFTRLAVLLIAILFVAVYCLAIATVDRMLEIFPGGAGR